MPKPETGVTKQQKPENQPPATLRDQLNSKWFKEQVEKLGTDTCTPERLIRIATTALLRVNHLDKCHPASVFECLFTLGQCGLEPDGRNAHLIPRWDHKLYGKDKGGYVCTLQIDYKGLVELAMRTGLVSSIHAAVVYDEDLFEYDLGEVRSHKPNFKVKHEKEDWYAVFAIVKHKDGGVTCDVMRQYEVFDIRDRSQSWRAFEAKTISTCPWHTDLIEMAKKTVFKRLTKWISISPQLDAAVEHDNDFEQLPQAPEKTNEAPPLVIPGPADSHDEGRRKIDAPHVKRLSQEQYDSDEGPFDEGDEQEESDEPLQEVPSTQTPSQEQREQEEIEVRAAREAADRPAWPQPVRNILSLLRRAETELGLKSIRNNWEKIKADHPEAAETVEKAFEEKAATVTPLGEKKK